MILRKFEISAAFIALLPKLLYLRNFKLFLQWDTGPVPVVGIRNIATVVLTLCDNTDNTYLKT